MIFAVAGAAFIIMLIVGIIFPRNNTSKPTDAEPTTDMYVAEEDSTSEEVEETEEIVEGNYLDSAEIAQNVKDKYEEEGLYTYGEPIYDIARDETITCKIEYDPVALGIQEYTEMYELYKDPDLKYPALCYFNRDAERQEIYLYPSTIVDGSVGVSELKEDFVNQFEHSKNVMFPKELNKDWGNFGTFYLATYRDNKTGEVLDKPIVQVVTVKGEIENRPQIRFQPTQNGLVRYRLLMIHRKMNGLWKVRNMVW